MGTEEAPLSAVLGVHYITTMILVDQREAQCEKYSCKERGSWLLMSVTCCNLILP